MSWVTIIWSMNAAACLTLAVIYFLVWCRNRAAWAHLLFSMTAVSTAAYAFCELAIMRSQTPADVAAALRWAQLAMFVWLVSLTWFVRIYLRAGPLWLAWTITGLRGFYLALTFLAGINVNFRAIALHEMPFLGESVTVIGGGVPNPLTLFGHFAIVLVLIFVGNASLAACRRGDRRRAWTAGVGIELFILTGLATTSAVLWGFVQAPIVVSHCYLAVIVVMGYELSRDVLRASQVVNELRTSEARLRESRARLSLAADAADFGLWIRDLTRHDIWASEKWRGVFGFTASERLEFGGILDRLHPDDREILQGAQARAMAGADEGRYQTEYRVMVPEGATRWISDRGRVEYDRTGQPLLIRGSAIDVTARKRAEQETQLLRQEIAHAGRVSTMGQLASALAHEISQPLTAILCNAAAGERFLDRSPRDIDAVRAAVGDIRSDAQRATAVIDHMRGLLRRQAIEPRLLDVASVVAEVTALVRADAANRQVTLEVVVPGGLPRIRADRVHVQQVLLNLIVNGMDALKGTRSEHRRLSVTARLDGAQAVEIAVDDRGPGIAADTLTHIFEPFFTTKPQGMGMGLAICRTIIDAHGGQLWAENRRDGGAAFRFTLPIAAATVPAVAADAFSQRAIH